MKTGCAELMSNSCASFRAMRNDYLQGALKVVTDPNILVNLVSRRVKQIRRGARPLVESLEKLSLEDTALREIMEGKISYTLETVDEAVGGKW